MFFEALIIGIIIGLLRRGKISRLKYINFNGKILIYLSALLYLAIIVMNLGLFNYSSSLYSAFLVILYLLTLIFLILNINMKFIFVSLIGLLMNLIVFVSNNFRFPLSIESAARLYGTEVSELLRAGKVLFFTPAEGAKLSMLGNTINIGNWLVVSPGDIVSAIGVILVIQGITSDKFLQNRNKITFSKNIFR